MINRLPWRKKLRTSAANNIDKINEIVDYINHSDISPVTLSEHGSGRSVTVGMSSSLKSLDVHGESIQDGTPAPDAPVEVQVVGSGNLIDVVESGTYTSVGNNTNVNNRVRTGYIAVLAETYYTVNADSGLQCSISYFSEQGVERISNSGFRNLPYTEQTPAGTNYVRILFRKPDDTQINAADVTTPQFEVGSTPTPYTPYGSIGILIGDTVTPIDLQGNALASLPDGTHDRLLVDSAGHVVIEKWVDSLTKAIADMSDSRDYPGWRYNSGIREIIGSGINSNISHNTALSNIKDSGIIYGANTSENNDSLFLPRTYYGLTSDEWKAQHQDLLVTIYAKRAEPRTADLGYIDMPAIESGDTISVSASIVPMIDTAWWCYDDVTDIIRNLKAYVDYKTADSQEPTAGLGMSRPDNISLDTQANQPAIVEGSEMI